MNGNYYVCKPAILAFYSTIILLLVAPRFSFSQTDCGNNAGFENGTTSGWTCKWGSYGSAACPPSSACPEFPLNIPAIGCLNSSGINASLYTGVDRHTIVDNTCYGTGFDPNTGGGPPVRTVALGGGNYSFRLGDDVGGGTSGGGTGFAKAEAIRFSFNVTPQNAGFTYQYAVFLEKPLAAFHTPEAEPRFEVILFDSTGSQVPCGYYKVVAGDWSSCPNTGNFQLGAYNPNNVSNFFYTDWTSVGLDLTGFIGHPVSIEFRTTDCFPSGYLSSSTTYINCPNGTCTITSYTYTNNTTCTDTCDAFGNCSNIICNGPLPCVNNTPGYHNAYAYIDAHCSPLSIQAPVVCVGTTSIQLCAPAGYASYSWPTIAGNPTTMCVTVNNPQAGDTYAVNLISVTGCPTQTTITLQGPDLIMRDTSFCAGTTGNVTITTAPAVPGSYTYAWTGPNSFSSTLQSPSIPIPSVTSTYTCTANDASGCQVTKTMTINILPQPAVAVSPAAAVCAGGSTTLTASGGVQYNWSPSATLNAPTDSVTTATPVQNTTYSVIVTDAGGCTNTASVTVTLHALPIVDGGNPVGLCPGDSTQLNATGALTYVWTPTATLSNPNIGNPFANPVTTTTYNVTGTDINGCTASDTVTIIRNPPVTVTISYNTAICSGASTILSASGGAQYSWSPAATLNTPTDSITTATPLQNTVYTVNVTDANGCSGVASVTVTVYSSPVVDGGPAVSICPGDITQLNATGALTYVWTPAATLSNPNIGNPVANPITTTTYSVTGTDNNGCTATDSVTVTISPTMTITVSPDTAVCPGSSTVLTASGGLNSTYVWTPTNTLINPNSANPTASPTTATTYSVDVTSATGCTGSGTVTVNINPLPNTDAGPDVTICNGGNTMLTANGGVSYLWSASPSLSCSLCTSPVANPSTTTQYFVTATNALGCSALDSVQVAVTAAAITVSPNAAICIGSQTQLSAGGGTIYSWSPASAIVGSNSVPNPIAAPSSTTTYTVNVTDAIGCKASGLVAVVVNPSPVVTASSSASIVCSGATAQLSASSAGAIAYSWLPASAVTNPNSPVTGATLAAATTFTVIITDINGCQGSNTITINVEMPPLANAGSNADICAGQSIQLNATGGFAYTWSPPRWLDNPNISNPVARPSNSITYSVTVSNGGLCQPATDAMTIIVHPLPLISAGSDTTIMAGTAVQLTATGSGITYQWTPANDLTCTGCYNPFANPLETTIYIVMTTDPIGCRNLDTVTVYVEDILTLYVPNSFTPSDYDSRNDIFYAYGVGIHSFDFYIFDRWGTKIFESHDPGLGWNGSFKGQIVQQDVYVWLARANSITGKSISKTGTVTVVR